ncbi:hypothetical protein COV11_00530 [Candidatus Woesearchaeota archaeon CG10_big_fil_rev_8_21_14_0_10_30_7]|nr:MAG: hypothetical protein COV11_00530 [Candidatus Woesearchaeota archaeon CG10_big_fil_rev_8_21_14_0_10_30_7]
MEKRVNVGKLTLIIGICLSILLISLAVYMLLPGETSFLPSFIPSILKSKNFVEYSNDLFNLTFTAKYNVTGNSVNFDFLTIHQNTHEKVRIDGELAGVKGYFLRLNSGSYFCNTSCKKIDDLDYFISLKLLNETWTSISSRDSNDCFKLKNSTLCFTEQGGISYFFNEGKELILTNITYSVGEVFDLK